MTNEKEKTEYKHSVSCSTEYKRNLGRPDGKFGSESVGASSQLTVKFDNPEDAVELLGKSELVNVIEKVRHITITDVSRHMHLEYILGEPTHEEPEFKTPELPDPPEENTDTGPLMFDAVCSNCGKDTQVPFKPNPNSKQPILCLKCYKKTK